MAVSEAATEESERQVELITKSPILLGSCPFSSLLFKARPHSPYDEHHFEQLAEEDPDLWELQLPLNDDEAH